MREPARSVGGTVVKARCGLIPLGMDASTLRWFDAHLDLAAMAVNGRDMDARPEDVAGPWPPASVTLTSLREGRVAAVLGTIFLEPDGADREGYPVGDVAAASARGVEQLAWYHAMARRGAIGLPTAKLVDQGAGGGGGGGGGGVNADAMRCLILVEGADAIKSPEELQWWVDRGVVAVGLSWAKGSRYAGGNTEQHGLTPLGKRMVLQMDRLGVVHDVSHLSDASMDEVFELAQGRIIASHSNCRGLLNDPANQRHLRDESIRAIAARGGVIGLNLFSRFLNPKQPDDATPKGDYLGERAPLANAVAHVRRVCDLTGSTRHVGLGSDMDGGFGADRLPRGIDGPRDLVKLAEALLAAGFSDEDVRGFAWGNWARFWGHA